MPIGYERLSWNYAPKLVKLSEANPNELVDGFKWHTMIGEVHVCTYVFRKYFRLQQKTLMHSYVYNSAENQIN